MSRRVVVPLDPSKDAEAALLALPRHCDAGDEIFLLSVSEPAYQTKLGTRTGRIVTGYSPGTGGATMASRQDVPVFGETKDQVVQDQLSQLQDYLLVHAHSLEKQGFKVQVIAEISSDPAQAIVEVARRVKPDFILMVRTTHPDFTERLFGTVAQHVIRQNAAPVLILPANSE